MRADMAHIIVERPRLGGGRERKGRAAPLDDLPSKESMRRPHAQWTCRKTLNENLAPLRRYLERQAGRPWNKVYSEIAKNIRADSTVQQHVLGHIKDFVVVDPRRPVQKVIRWIDGQATSERLWSEPLYVDPKDGILKRTDRLPEVKARKARQQAAKRAKVVDRIAIAADRELRLLNGLWFEVTLAPLPDPEYMAFTEIQKVRLNPYYMNSRTVEMEVTVRRLIAPPVKDIVTGSLIQVGPPVDNHGLWREYRRLHPDRRYSVAKRMLSRSELKKHGLSNQQAEV